MSLKVKPLMTGPMIGHTSENSFRLWGRATSSSGAVIGIVRVRKSDAVDFSSPVTFEFHDYYDDVGIVDISGLCACTEYSYQIGWVKGFGKSELDALIDGGVEFSWGERGKPDINGSVITFPTAGLPAASRFILGSCRDSLGDKGEGSFNEIYEMATDVDERPDFMIMAGDQIYIDHMHIFKGFKLRIKKYWKKYRKAYDLSKFNKVTRQVPSYMMMDDHEIQNDWTLGKFVHDEKEPSKKRREFNMQTLDNGLRAFEAYQASLSPRLKSVEDFHAQGFLSEGGKKQYWYDFQHGDSSFFVCDTRGESEVLKKRPEEKRSNEPRVLGDQQVEALKLWLENKQGKVKFIVSPIPFFPDTKGLIGSPGDKWFYAAKQRHDILEFIRTSSLTPKVVILSGDVHVSGVAELTHNTDPFFKVYNIISSAFNWFTPGLQEDNFDWGGLIAKKTTVKASRQGNALISDYVSRSLFTYKSGKEKIFKRNNFAVIDVVPQESGGGVDVNVEFFRGVQRHSSLGKTQLFRND